MSEQVVVGQAPSRATPMGGEMAWATWALVGWALVIVGFIDIAMLYFPARLASVDWEFGTISGTVDGMPLMTIGMGAITAAAAARGRRGWMRAISVAQLVVTLVLLVLLGIYASDIPVALRAVEPALQPTLTKAIIKTVVMGGVYVVLYVSLGVWTWRRSRSTKGVAR